MTAEPTLDLAGLMQAHQAGVWRYLRALGADTALADDLTQDTFLAVHQNPFQQRTRAETASYLRTVARNLYLKSRRNAGREVNSVGIERIDARWNELVHDDGTDLQQALQQCLGELEDKPRHALEMQYSNGMQRVEIAKAMSMTDDGVKTLLARTKARLRKCMEQRVKGSF